jgi:hypothetical protein
VCVAAAGSGCTICHGLPARLPALA